MLLIGGLAPLMILYWAEYETKRGILRDHANGELRIRWPRPARRLWARLCAPCGPDGGGGGGRAALLLLLLLGAPLAAWLAAEAVVLLADPACRRGGAA